MNIKELSIEQLKAHAYDQIGTIEIAQNNLKVINEEIQNRNAIQSKVAKEIVEPPKKK